MSDTPASDLNPLAARALPVLPLSTGVVLPSMVVTIALETPEATAAADAAVDRQVLLVPRLDGRYAVRRDRGHHRGPGRAPWWPARPGRPRGRACGDRCRRARQRRRTLGPARTCPGVQRGHRPGPGTGPGVQGRGGEHPGGPWRGRPGRRHPRRRRPRCGGGHGRLLPGPGRGAEGAGPGGARRGAPPRPGAAVGQGDPGRPVAQGAHPPGRDRGHGADPAGVPAAPAAGRHPEGTGTGVHRG